MATCKSCGRDNQDLYKFCLGCGAELGDTATDLGDGMAAQVIERTAELPPEHKSANGTGAGASSSPSDGEEFDLKDRRDSLAHLKPLGPMAADIIPADNTDPNAGRVCPQCGTLTSSEFAFCSQCGARVDAAAGKPAPPRTRSIPAPDDVSGQLILIRPDGTEGGTHQLAEGENIIGRGIGSLFDADGYLSPRHAELVLNAAGLVVRDAGSLNGVFVKLADEEQLVDGDIFRIGQELLRFDEIEPPVPLDDGTDIMGSPNPGYWGRLALIVGRDQDGSAFPLFGDAVTLGRERGDILFPEDGYVSGAHARVSLRDGRYFLTDLNSSNGTFLRVRGERALPNGASLLMGQQLFRVQY
jgi:pSer/pThr/pTyr-binding forkhead associated (FHA) protein